MDLTPVDQGKLLAGISSLNACTIQKDVYPVPIFEEVRDQGCDRLGCRKVCLIDSDLATQLLDCRLRCRIVRVSLYHTQTFNILGCWLRRSIT